jgi:S-disulfanyl-L-cysteine oxidoreductase SoxD
MRRIGLLVLSVSLAAAQSPKYKVGRPPTPEEIKTWDSWVTPDGKGLPDGKGVAAEGKEVYSRRCARCHGDDAKGGDAEALVGGQGSLKSPKPLKTVGSFWPYATTLFDYINRAMPFKEPGTLNPNQVYAVSAYILNLNGIIGPNDEMNAKTLPQVKMPNRNGFVPDARPDVGSKKKR